MKQTVTISREHYLPLSQYYCKTEAFDNNVNCKPDQQYLIINNIKWRCLLTSIIFLPHIKAKGKLE